jgi:hypothetical protein
MSSSFRNFSQTGMALSQGPPSSGIPGPPLEMRQKRKVSRSIGMVPLSSKFVGIGGEAVDEHAVPLEVVAVAEDAVLVVDALAFGDVLPELLGVRGLERAERVLAGVEVDRLVVHRHRRGGGGVDGAGEERRLERRLRLQIDVRRRRARDQHQPAPPGASGSAARR